MANKMHAGHGFLHTSVEHHNDGSVTVHHVHKYGEKYDVKHAVGNLDELHDSMQEHLDPEKAEERVKKLGFDPESLEETVHPHLHEEALMKSAHQQGKDADDVEEEVDPGIHNRILKLVE